MVRVGCGLQVKREYLEDVVRKRDAWASGFHGERGGGFCIAFLHNIEITRFAFRRRVLECGGRGRVERVRFVFGVPATADTALRCSSALESPTHRGHLKVWLRSKAVSAVAKTSLVSPHVLGATSATALHMCHRMTAEKSSQCLMKTSREDENPESYGKESHGSRKRKGDEHLFVHRRLVGG
jgi:hypothetical protein